MKRVSTTALIVIVLTVSTYSTASAFATDGIAASTPNFIKAAMYVGPTSPTQQIRLVVHLAYPNPYAAFSYASAVSNPMSLSYGAFMTPDQFAAAFAPSRATYSAAIATLQAGGFSIVGTYSNHKVIDAVGPYARQHYDA